MKANPYIEGIELKRIYPSIMTIVVKERKATYVLKIEDA